MQIEHTGQTEPMEPKDQACKNETDQVTGHTGQVAGQTGQVAGQTGQVTRAIALFSGGLDSILAAKTIRAQGIEVKCLHFYSPFFGKPHLLEHWRKIYDLDIIGIDLSSAFVNLLMGTPKHGYGKVINPCVDCKIIMMTQARQYLTQFEAQFIISGEVLGQRPMSQRRDTLNVIRKESGLDTILLRPLSALHLKPTAPETQGLVDRTKLHGIFGRGRQDQLALAKHFQLPEIPTPAGGCRLAEKENARRYWAVLTRRQAPSIADFYLANVGRQFWANQHWLCLGRNEDSNNELQTLATDQDIIIRIKDFPGPFGILRSPSPSAEIIAAAAAMVASYSPKACQTAAEVTINLLQGQTNWEILAKPQRTENIFIELPDFETMKAELKLKNKSNDIALS